MRAALLPLLLLPLAACSSTRGALPLIGGSAKIVDLEGTTLNDGEVTAWMLDHDVVFWGELHDSDPGHERLANLFAELVERAAAERRTVTLSLEMFERDVQDLVDDYLLGRIDEATFLAHSRPWGNYAEHYRPLVELCRTHGLDVVAANIPRRVARQVSKEGADAIRSSLFAPRALNAEPGEYRDRMAALMLGASHGSAQGAGHGSDDGADEAFERLFRAQAIKDDVMAESIARHERLPRARAHGRPLIVHLCGRFHSDYDLGTVERLAWRRPDLTIGTLSMVPSDESTEADAPADLLMRLP